MSQKSDLQVLVAALQSAMDQVKSAVDLLSDGDADLQKKIDELLLQVADLSTQLDAAKAALASEDAMLQADEAKIAKLKEILLG